MAARSESLPQSVSPATLREWQRALAAYDAHSLRRALWEIAITLVPYGALVALMFHTVARGLPYMLTLALAVPAGGFLMRAFILFHDAGHGSLFASRAANTALGYVLGILAFTPFEDWRRAHAIHHSTAANLDKRGTGDVWTLTVEEYRAARWWVRVAYRVFRFPLVTFGLGPTIVFLLRQRFPLPGGRPRDRLSVLYTNLAIAGIVATAALTVGLRAYVLVQLPIFWVAGLMGVWLFYVQHQFKGVYWARSDSWDPLEAALRGSSFYDLPPVLRWFTANIGYHHLHHVRPRIPSYNLPLAQAAFPALQTVKPLKLGASLASARLHLYDEQHRELVGWNALRQGR